MANQNNNYRAKPQMDTRPRNEIITVPIILDGLTDHDETYDVDQLLDIFREIDSSNVIKLISIPVNANRGYVLGNDTKGTMAVGYLKSIDVNGGKLEVVIYSKYTDKFGPDYCKAKCRVIIDKKDKYVKQIIGIDLVTR